MRKVDRGTQLADATATPGAAAAGRAYGVDPAEFRRPAGAGETGAGAGADGNATDWWWIILAGLGLAVLVGYTKVWPAAQQLLYNPSPARDYLLPVSPNPVYVIFGVGVGWFWVLLIAAPAAAVVLGILWWAVLAWNNHRARAGHMGHVRPGQPWIGEQHPTGPVVLLAAAAILAAAGALLRWAAPAMAHLPGRILVTGLLVAVAFGFTLLVKWVWARGLITRQVNRVTFLASPALGWTDLRAGRVQAVSRCYPRGAAAFPKVVKLFYSQHPRFVDDGVFGEIAEVLYQVTGRTYAIEHDPFGRVLIATESQAVAEDPIGDAEAVLGPLVSSWFDASASIESVKASEPSAAATDDEDAKVAEDPNSVRTEKDVIAGRINEFTVVFAYTQRMGSPYQRGRIESMVCDALGGSWEAHWSVPSRRVTFMRSPGLPTMVSPPMDFPTVTRETIRKIYKHSVIPIGIDAYGNIAGWDFTQSPHCLIAGQTSSGKTSVLMTIATQAARRGMNVVWVDPKGFDSPGMHAHPNVSLVTAGTDEDGLVGHVASLRFIADTMRDRLTKVKTNPNRANDFDPIVVIADEFSNLVVALNEFYMAYKTSKEKGGAPTTKDVGILLRTARAVAIHIAIGIQRPDTMFIAGEARDNTALRVSMGRLRSKDAAIMMFNDPVAGTRIQPGIRGRGTVQMPDGSFREIQAFYTPQIPATDEQMAKLTDKERAIVNELRNVDSFWPRRVVDSALRGYDPEDEDEQPMSFARIRESAIVLASERPDVDPISGQYVVPVSAEQRPTMDDDELIGYGSSAETVGPDRAAPPAASFGGPVDGFDDDYLPTIDDEYGPEVTVTAEEIGQGDLVELSVDGGTSWKYVHAEPYVTDDAGGNSRIVLFYRDIENSQDMGDTDFDPYEVLQVRRLHMG